MVPVIFFEATDQPLDVPWTAFVVPETETAKVDRTGKEQYPFGIVPLNWLLINSSSVTEFQDEEDVIDGKVPIKSLSLTSNTCNSGRSSNDEGIDPVKRLLVKFNSCSSDVVEPSTDGIEPVRLLLFKASDFNAVKWDKVDGIMPTNEGLFARVRVSNAVKL